MTRYRTLGIIMAKGDSVRTPNKNVLDICGKPTLAYPIASLRASAVCDRIIVSTDSDTVGELGVTHGADDYVMRDAWTDRFPEFSVTANDAWRKYQERTGDDFDVVVVSGGNVMFLRPSWIRAARLILLNYADNRMPIDVVGMEPEHWNVNVCRVRQGIMTHPNFFVFKHIGILMEMDWRHEIDLARQIVNQINSGNIDYPLDEDLHKPVVENMVTSPNRMGSLSPLTEYYGAE